MSWANALTALRLAAAPLSAWAVATTQWRLALVVFGLAVVTDLLDGATARRLGQVSRAGGFFDHATDCVFVTATIGGLVVGGAPADIGMAPWVLVALIPLAFLQYTLDSGMLAGRALRTNAIGKANGIGYFILPGAIITREALGLDWLPMLLPQILAWVLVATTLVSMADRLLHLIRELRQAP